MGRLGKNLHHIVEPSFRYYVRAGELKAAGMDWTEVLALEAENRRARLAAEILASASYRSTMDRARAFVQRGGRIIRVPFLDILGRTHQAIDPSVTLPYLAYPYRGQRISANGVGLRADLCSTKVGGRH